MSGVNLMVAKIWVNPSVTGQDEIQTLEKSIFQIITFAHYIAFHAFYRISKAVNATCNLLRKALPTLFSYFVCLFSSLCVLQLIRC